MRQEFFRKGKNVFCLDKEGVKIHFEEMVYYQQETYLHVRKKETSHDVVMKGCLL